MGKQVIITIDGKDYDAAGFQAWLNGLHPEARDLAIKDIIKQMVAENPAEAKRVFTEAIRSQRN